MTDPKKINTPVDNPAPPTDAPPPEAPPANPENAYRPPGMPTQEDIEKIQQQQKLHMERMQQAHQQEQALNIPTLTYLQRQLMGDPSNDIQPDPLITVLITDINAIIAQICRYAGAEYRPFLALDIFNAFCIPEWQNEWQQPWKPVTPPRYAPYIAQGGAEKALDQRASAIFGTAVPEAPTPTPPQAAQVNPGSPKAPGHKRNTRFRER